MKHLHRFFSSDASGGIILIIAAILAMIMANSGATSGWYHDFLETPVQLRVGSLEINKNMLLWINDALMAVFFLLVGLEVKRELMQGSLASLRQAAFPVIAAIGGMIVPALLYLAFNYADPITREGWAIENCGHGATLTVHLVAEISAEQADVIINARPPRETR